MKPEIIIAVASLFFCFIAQIIIISVVAGKLINRISSVEKDNNNLGIKIVELDKKVDDNKADSFKDFVLREVNSISNEMNSKEHENLAIAIEKQTGILEAIQVCIHKMQSRKECD